MSKDAFDGELEMYFNSLEETYECSECGTPINHDGDVCSDKCWQASML